MSPVHGLASKHDKDVEDTIEFKLKHNVFQNRNKQDNS